MMTSCPAQLSKCKFCVSFISSSQNWVSLCDFLASPWGQRWLGCLITRRHCCAFSQSVPRTSQLGTQARALPALPPAPPSGTPSRLPVYVPIYLYDISYLHTFHTWWNMFEVFFQNQNILQFLGKICFLRWSEECFLWTWHSGFWNRAV